jgi:hypothetical protein
MVGFRFRRQKATAVTLTDELQALERRAGQERAAAGEPYNKALLARESGVPERTLRSWLEGKRTPKDAGNLMRVVGVLSCWAGVDAGSEQRWLQLNETARRKGPVSSRKRFLGAVAAVLSIVVAVVTVISGLFGPVGTDLFSSQSTASPSPSQHSAANQQEGLQASASWCCHLTSVEASAGFYWPGSSASLGSALSGTNPASLLTYAGVGIVEIPLQTSGTEPIYVAPPQVIVRNREPNVRQGIAVIMGLGGGQGVGAATEFQADVDASTPVTVPFTAGSGQPSQGSASDYYYVSSGSPEVLILAIEDTDCDCTFDVRLTWQAQGQRHSTLLTNGGRHFRIVGSSGLAWYTGNRVSGGITKLSSQRPFSAYAP